MQREPRGTLRISAPASFGWMHVSPAVPALDLYVEAEAEAFVKWHAGQLTWAQATRDDRIQLDGDPSLVRAFPTWNARSMFAHIRPASHAATSPAG